MYYGKMNGHNGMWGTDELCSRMQVRSSPVIPGDEVETEEVTPFLATVDEVEARLLSEEADDLPLD